ncbi:MAG: hypothetical protein PVF17_00985 [Ignavibacteria bacterium]|jgi:hypothetical protein
MEKLTKFFRENITKGALILLFITAFGSLWNPSRDLISYLFNDNVNSMIEHVITQSIQKSLREAKVDYSLQLMQMETKNVRTPTAMDKKVKFWKDNNWNAQIVAMNIVLRSEYAKKKIKETIYNEEVYKAFISHR